jgi:lipoprotein NlpI
VLTTACGMQLASDAEKCQDAKLHPDLAVQGCTAAIASGQLSKEDLVAALVNRSLAYYYKGASNRAIQDADKAISLKPDCDEAFTGRGLARELKGDFDGALQDYNQAIRLQPRNTNALNDRALIYDERKEDHDRAIQDFDRAIAIRPDYSEAFSNRAHSYFAKGDYARAIQDYDQAIKLEPSYTGNFFDRATAFNSMRDYARALQDLDQARRLNPKDPDLWCRLGITNFYLGRLKTAQEALGHSLTLLPDSPFLVVWLFLASSRGGHDAKDEMKANSARLKSTDWPRPAVQMYLGSLSSRDLLLSAKDKDDKKTKVRTCQAYFYLGQDALMHGRLAEAKDLFEKSVKVGSAATYEYVGAVAELDRMKAPQQPAGTISH